MTRPSHIHPRLRYDRVTEKRREPGRDEKSIEIIRTLQTELRMKHGIKIKRVYETPDKNDGSRILVDRLWPRGLTKEKAKVDLWLKEIAPSTELRKWFGHDPKKWQGFRGRYETELKHHDDQLKLIKRKAKEGMVTLIYGSRDQEHNEAVVLKQFLERRQ